MEERTKTEGGTGKGRKFLLAFLLICAATVTLLFVAVQGYLASPYPAGQISRILSSSLGETVTVSGVGGSGATVQLKGLRIANPPGFPAGNLVFVDSLSIAPDWIGLLTGKRSFRLIALGTVRVDAVQNRAGEWNFTRLQRHLAAQKPSPAETVVRRLSVQNGSLAVNGRATGEVSLEVFNLTSKGSRDSSVSLDFQDAWRNRYQVRGRARPGPSPALDLTVRADTFSFAPLYALLPPGKAQLVSGGSGRLALQAALEKGVATCEGSLDFRDVRVAAGGSRIPLSGRLTLSGGYDQGGDRATVKGVVLALDHLVTLRGSGSAAKLRGERSFNAELAIDETELSRLPFLLPEGERRRTSVAGKISGRAIRLAGTGSAGVTEASGSLLLRDARLERDGRTLFSGLNMTTELRRGKGGVLATGRATARAGGAPALVEKLDAPFAAAFSPKLSPLSARVTLSAARVSGTDLTGRLAYTAGGGEPFTISADIPSARAAALNPLLKGYDLRLSSGTGALSLTGAGRSATDFSASLKCRVSELAGVRGQKSFAVGRGAVEGALQRKRGALSAAGKVGLSPLSLDGRKGSADFSYRLAANNVLTLEAGTVRLADTTATFATLAAALPRKGEGGYPVSVDLSGASLRHPKAELSGLSGTVRGRYVTDPKGGWLEGESVLAAQKLSWQGKEVAAPTGRFTFSRTGGKGVLGGTVLGGGVEGSVLYQPAVPEQGEFKVRVAGAQLKALSELLPPRKGPTVAQGVLDLSADGSYARNGGINCRFKGGAKGVVVKGDAKSILSDGGAVVSGNLAGETLSIASAEFSAGGARLRLQGELEKAFSPQRTGRFTFSMPTTALNDLIDPFVNVLPRVVQEANTGGGVAAEGSVALRDGKELLEGTLSFDDVRLEVPSQKLVVSGLKGKVPVSLDLAGKESGKPGAGLSVSRENYPRLLQQLQQKTAGGAPLSVKKVSYGTLDLGTVTMELHAEQGLTEIRSLRASLYDGVILGKGAISMKKGGTFRVDLLANGVSLKNLCDAIPNIEGYISGRLDGFVSITGTGGGLKGLVGFTNLWARQGQGEKMLVSKEFLQRLAKQKLSGFFFSSDRAYDKAEIRAQLQDGDLTFEALDLQHTNFLGVRDLSVSIAPSQNRIAIDHLLESIRQAATRGKAATGAPPTGAPPAGAPPAEAPAEQPEFKWQD